MSVQLYQQARLQELYDQAKSVILYGADRVRIFVPEAFRENPHASTDAEQVMHFGWALECASFAQIAAYARTYRGEVHPTLDKEGLDADAARMRVLNGRKDRVELADAIGNVLYNCVSNGGTDFCPDEARRVLEQFRFEIYRIAAHQGA